MKFILITGGTSGIGRETVKALAATGATVVFTARDREKGEKTKREIVRETGNNAVEYLVCDLASLSSIRACAEEYKSRWKRLDVLINNAGVMPRERQESKDGFELNLAVNFLAPFLLTNLLLTLLKASAPARVVNVASHLHRQGRIDFDDLQNKKDFDHYKAYADSKLALILFTKKLARDLADAGVTVNALHPGVVATKMNTQNIAHMNPVVRFAYEKTFLSPEKGAATSVYLATSPEVGEVSGEYFDKKKIVSASPLADDGELADKLWGISEKLVGL